MEFIHGLMIAAALVVGPAPQQQPAAAGKAVCAGCHEAVTAQFDRSAHSGLVLKDGGARLEACEACHGNGVKHAEAGGGAEGIRSFKTMSDADAAQACLALPPAGARDGVGRQRAPDERCDLHGLPRHPPVAIDGRHAAEGRRVRRVARDGAGRAGIAGQAADRALPVVPPAGSHEAHGAVAPPGA